ncbi:MAG TPA: DNA mismatch endonuclease Vsr [Bryobacteraceae bacterium]|nr:DNA mismatch endonuclease Vsr [Bryobacteraceae bacterium]HPT25921.1 DNA mismatch endonuclease Vsr [Bryobacteraceae bacterium]
MRAVRSVDTGPEMAVRRMVHGMGYRYRLHGAELPGKPDMVFAGLRKVIFVHGCFWHQHRCPAAARPTSRREYWDAKLDGNIRRDRKNIRRLHSLGWDTLVVWECQIKNASSLKRRLVEFLNKQK